MNASQFEANKVLRVLSNKPLKFTVRVHLPDDRIFEWQAADRPTVKWNDHARGLWLYHGQYGDCVCMAWPDGAILLCEENPKPE